jgi:hypothetical protein
VSSVNWNDKSLDELKGVVEQTEPGGLDTAIVHFHQSVQHLSKIQDSFMGHMNSLGDAWQGKAATAAIGNAQNTYASMDDTRSNAATAATQTSAYQTQMRDQRTRAERIPSVDTSWGHAFSSGGLAGPIGVGAAKMAQQRKYDHNQGQLAQIVTQMDTDGSQHAEEMKSTPWLVTNTRQATPPGSLPPVPGAAASKAGGSSLPSNGYNGAGSHTTGGGGYTPPVPGPSRDPGGIKIINGPKPHHPAPGTVTTPGSGPSPNPQLPTTPQGGGGVPGTPGGVPGGPTVAGAPTTAAPGGAGAAAAVLGGAGLLGAGAAGGRGLLSGAGGRGGVAGEPEGRVGARDGSGLAEGEGGPRAGGGRSGAGLGEGEGGLRGGSGSGSGGLGEEGGLRGGPRASTGIPADEELGGPRSSMLRGAGSGGFAGEPVAGEAGRMGGYPMGGSGARRRNDDEEAPMPDYLVETDDIWGDGASAAPPVIGE